MYNVTLWMYNTTLWMQNVIYFILHYYIHSSSYIKDKQAVKFMSMSTRSYTHIHTRRVLVCRVHVSIYKRINITWDLLISALCERVCARAHLCDCVRLHVSAYIWAFVITHVNKRFSETSHTGPILQAVIFYSSFLKSY